MADGVTYAYDYTYDSETGALDTLTYPTSTSSYRLALKYAYLNGTLNAVKDNATNAIFWQADEINPRGQVTHETLGNGLKTTRIFDAVTGWVSAIQCGPNGGTCSQNQGYLYDLVGNVKQRQNNNLGLTEDFWYDELNRLDYSKLNNQLNLDMGYDAMGNITSKSDVAGGTTWTYDTTHKHQLRVAGTGGVSYIYDANGNVVTRGGQTISWDPYNYPTLFNAAGESIALYYNANHERWKQVQTTAAVQVTTVYAGKLFEKVTIGSADEYRHYIYANGSAVAVMSRASGGGATTRYLLRDHQGSVTKITDGAGAAVVSESFTPFGERRNPATWSGVPVNGELAASANVTQQGYTGQDGLGSFGLNHMNGRVQDAVTGRFLSADPYVTEPWNTQNFNRYSYVYNNPLTFIDPSGFDCEQGPTIADCMPPYDGGGGDRQPPSAPPMPVFNWGDFELANPSATGTPMETTAQIIPPVRGPIGAGYSVVSEPLPEEGLRGGFLDLLRATFQWVDEVTAPGDFRCGVNVNCLTFPLWGTPRGAVGSLAARSVNGLEDLALFRSQLGVKVGEGALARLDIGGRSFYGINAHGQAVSLRVNAITRTHAEADAFQQAVNASMRAPSATLYVDKALCVACGTNGGVVGMARQLGIGELRIVTPDEIQIVRIGL